MRVTGGGDTGGAGDGAGADEMLGMGGVANGSGVGGLTRSIFSVTRAM